MYILRQFKKGGIREIGLVIGRTVPKSLRFYRKRTPNVASLGYFVLVVRFR
jgi:hypothetical protein